MKTQEDKECFAKNIVTSEKLEKQRNFRSNSSLGGQILSHRIKSDNPSDLRLTHSKSTQAQTIIEKHLFGQTSLSALINSTKFQLCLMIMLPEILLIVISVMLVELHLSYTADSLSKFSSCLYRSSVEFVRIQTTALQMSLELQLQNEAILLNAMHSLQFKTIRGEVLFQEHFQNPILNIDQTYLNKGDAYLLQQFKKNLTLLLSSWHQKNAIEVNQLDEFSQTQLDVTTSVDFLLRSAFVTNQADLSGTNKLLIYQYFFSFGHDGMLIFTKGVNMTYSRFVDQPPCLSGIYHVDTRCRPYFLSGKNKDILTAFPPTVLQQGSSNKYYATSGFCKRQAVPLSMLNDGFEVNSLNNGVYSQVCNSIQLEQISFIFDRFASDPEVVIMLLDPVSMNLMFSSRQTTDQTKIISFEEAYLRNLEDSKNREYFLRQVKSYAAENMGESCFEIGSEYDQKSTDFSFNFTEKGEETIVFINHISSFDLQQNHTDDVYGESSPITLDSGIYDETDNNSNLNSKRKICISSYWILLIVFPKTQLMQQAIELEQQMNTINNIFQSMIYIGLGGSVLIFCIYVKSISFMIIAPVKRLTYILKELNLCQATVAYNHLSEEESEDIFYSADARVLFESFRKLFVTLVFATQSMLGDKQCQTLLNLNKQIIHFKQLKNYRAVGICANNIGNIHHNSSRYIEALESYHVAIIYAKYELEMFKEKEEEKVEIISSKEVILPLLHHFVNLLREGGGNMPNSSRNSYQQAIPENQQKIVQQEIYWILYNRKFNFLKSLIGLMRENKGAYTDWPTAKIIANELQDISDTKLLPNEKRKIILNQIELYIHCNTGDIQAYMNILNENKLLIQSPEFNKPNETEQNNLNSQSNKTSRSKRDSNAKNTKNSRSTKVIQQKRQTLYSNSNFLSISNANTSCNRLDSSSKSNVKLKASSNNQNIIFKDQESQLQNHIPEVILRAQQFHQTHIRLGSLTPNEKEDNTWHSQSQLNSSNMNQTIEKLHESGQNLLDLCSSQQLKSDENHLNLRQQHFNASNQNTRVVLKHFTMKNPRGSSRKQSKKYQNDNKKDSKIELVVTESNLPRNAKTRNSINAECLPEEFLPQKEKQAIFLSTRPMKQSDNSKFNQKSRLVSTKRLTKSQMDTSERFSFIGRSKSKYLMEGQIEDIPEQVAPNTADKPALKPLEVSKELVNYDNNPYMQETFLFQGIVRWEEATILLMKQSLYESAVQFTLFFEDTYNVLPVMQYQAFDMLAFIFSQARLRDSTLERMASKYELETSFKISVLAFNSMQETDQRCMYFSGNKELNQEGDNYYSLNFEGWKLAEAVETFWEEVTQNVMKNQDDMIGVLVGSYDQQKIEQKISMVTSKFLNLNLGLFQQSVSNFINRTQDIGNEQQQQQRQTEEHVVVQINSNNEDSIQNSIQISTLQLSSGSQNKLENYRRLSLMAPQTPQEMGNIDLGTFNTTQIRVPELVPKKINNEQNEHESQNYLKASQVSELTNKRGSNEISSFSQLIVQKPQNEVHKIKCQETLCNHDSIVFITEENEDSNNKHNTTLISQWQQSMSRQVTQQHPSSSQHNFISESCSDNEKFQHKLLGEGIPSKLIRATKTQEYTDTTPFRSAQHLNQESHDISFLQKQEKSSFTTSQQYPDPKTNQLSTLSFQQHYQRLGIAQKSYSLTVSAELRYLFLMGVRKSLQSVLLCQEINPNCIYFQVKIAETRASLIRELELLREKRSLNHFELHKKQYSQITKKFSVVITDSLFFIKPNDKALAVLLEQSLRFSILLLILCLHEDQAAQFKSQIPLEYADIVFVFTTEKSLINHMISERAPTNFNFFPLSVEHF